MCWLDEILAAIRVLEQKLDDLKWMAYLAQTRQRSNLSEIIRPTYGAKVPTVKSPLDKEIDGINRAIDQANKRKQAAELAKARQKVLDKTADLHNASKSPLTKKTNSF